MSCSRNCYQDNKEAFDRATCVFSSRRALVVFLLNILLNIKKEWEKYCYCEMLPGKCSVCRFRDVFKDDEYQIYKNCFDLHFLAEFHLNFYNCLERLLAVNNHVVCHLINVPFRYHFKDWFTGSDEYFDLPYCVEMYEKREIEKITSNGCRVVIGPLSYSWRGRR